MERISGVVKHYEWGSKDSTSYVAKLARGGNHRFDTSSPFHAELWLGTHCQGFSLYKGSNTEIPLKLPYLLKVLSIGKALSIQVHPNRKMAEILHQTKPNIYTDPNPKPEVAIPLTRFEALAGLNPPDIVEHILKEFPELLHIHSITALLLTDGVVDLIPKIIDRLEEKPQLSELERLILSLNVQYPNDVGVLCPIYMTYHVLYPGQAMYIPPGCPHAYLAGELIEGMVCSDNVIRVALTNKLKDTPTLLQILNNTPCTIYDGISSFNVADEFTISYVKYEKQTVVHIPKLSLVLVITGESRTSKGIELKEGYSFYVEEDFDDFVAYDDLVFVICQPV